MSDPDLVVVRTAKSPFEAEVLAGVLRGADVAVYVDGAMLNDEFAMSQQLAGLQHVELRVRAEDEERAKAALKEADESSELLDDENFDPGDRVD